MRKALLKSPLVLVALVWLAFACGPAGQSFAQVRANPARLRIANAAAAPLELSAADLKSMPRTTLRKSAQPEAGGV
jgi:hypothetical protein